MATTSVTPASQPATTRVITREEGMASLGLTVEGKPLAESTPTEEVQEKPAVTEPGSAPDASVTAAAPEAAKNQESKPGSKNANTRIRELAAKNRILEAQLEEARRGRTAEPSTAPAKETQPEPVKVAQPPKEPNSSDFKTWEEYEVANKKYVKDLVAYETKQALESAERNRVQAEQTRTFQQQLDDGEKRYPGMKDVIKPLTDVLANPTKAGIEPAVAGMISNSPVLPDLLYVLGSDQAQLDDFLEKAKSDPVKAIRLVVLTEQMVMEELTKSGKTTEPESETTPAPRKTPVPPRPASEVNTRGATPPDELTALREKRARGQVTPADFSRLRALENAARLKQGAK